MQPIRKVLERNPLLQLLTCNGSRNGDTRWVSRHLLGKRIRDYIIGLIFDDQADAGWKAP